MSQADASPRRKRRPWLRGLAIALGVILAVLAGIYVFRKEIAAEAARLYLESQDVTVQSLEVTLLESNEVELRDIALGDARELTIDRLRLEPGYLAITGTAMPVLDIQGLRLQVDVAGVKPLLGSLQPFVERLTATSAELRAGEPQSSGTSEAAADAEITALPVRRVVLSDSTVVFATPSGPMTAALDGILAPDAGGVLEGGAILVLDSDLGRLEAKLNARRAADGAISVNADVADGHLAWQTLKVDSFHGRVSATGTGTNTLQLNGSLDLAGLSHTPQDGPALHLSHATIETAFSTASFLLTTALEGEGERLDLKAAAQLVGGDDGTLLLVVDVDGEAETAGGLARLVALPGPAVTKGTLVLEAGSTSALGMIGTPEGEETLLTLWRDPAGKLLREGLTLSGEAILAGVALADDTRGVSGHLPLSVTLAENQAVLTLTRDAALRVEQPSRESLRDIGVPDDLLPLVASGLNLTLASGGDLPFRLAATPAWPPEAAEIAVAADASSAQGVKLAAKVEGAATLDGSLAPERFDGSVEARAEAKALSFGGREARGVAITLPLTADYGEGSLRLALAKRGSLRITQFGKGAPLRLEALLDFTLDSLTVDAASDTGGYRYSLKGREDGAKMALTAADRDPIDIIAGALSFGLEGKFDPATGHDATLTTRLAGLALPGYDFSADAVAFDIGLDRDLRPATSRFTLGPFQVTGDPALTEPLMLAGSLKRKGRGYDLTGNLTLAEGETLAALSGRYGDDGTARITIDGQPVTFAPDGLQPAQLSPLLAELKDVSGTIEADGELTWPRQPATEHGNLSVTGLSFSGPAKVEGLGLTLKLDSLLPPASPPGQRLTIASLEAGLPVEDITVAFALDPKPALAVAEGGFELDGAHWRIEPATLDPAAQSNRVALATDALDLATLFDLLGVDGLSGTGTLQGRLPVVFSAGEVIIDESRFEALGPGVLSIRINALRSALAGSGEVVEAAVKALEDFRYENLTITLAKTAQNDATVKLSTLGSNPDVLDGQPFQFNINLESNLTSVLNALKQGYSLSDDALKRAWKLRQ